MVYSFCDVFSGMIAQKAHLIDHSIEELRQFCFIPVPGVDDCISCGLNYFTLTPKLSRSLSISSLPGLLKADSGSVSFPKACLKNVRAGISGYASK